MAKYLSENEVGFDQSELGFPSISGCHAIVYVTADGLFGYHSYGGADRAQWPGRSAAFAGFVNNHAGGPGAGKLLYGVCYAIGNRGYGNTAPKQEWTGELTAFADALGYDGEIWGYDLAGSSIPLPAYVLYHRPVGTSCVIQVKAWNQADGARGPNPSPDQHQMIARRGMDNPPTLGAANNVVVTSVTTAGLRTVYPEKLRG